MVLNGLVLLLMKKWAFRKFVNFIILRVTMSLDQHLCSAFNLDVYESFTPTQKKVVEIAAKATSLNNYSLGLANNGAALKRIVAQGVKLMEFPENVWDLFGESAVKAMDKYMDDSLYAQIRESYETSLRGTTSWLDRADRTYVKQRARVYNL